ncbi:uncharacterized protein C8A04DRAFT_13688 [Dichotomopilus funicola]|uniref:DUF7136 domain-containing protein n=1 Tax=Dichotomopilus funicola TaxID=1934379 RepID=A0AAN6ZKK2_9PEZI|nr:hypothetical protein C8A04DRAFT_13688 [Dichotomopilus funicola]
MTRLAPLLLASLSSFLSSAIAQTNDTTRAYQALVELDQVFPQNATYTPAPVFPIVFALQDLPRAWASTYVRVTWILSSVEGLYPGKYENGTITIDHADYPDPYYITAWSRRLNSTNAAGHYYLYWFLEYEECLGVDVPSTGIDFKSRNGVLQFTLASESNSDNKAQKPDLLNVVDKCPVVNGAFKIRGTFDREGGAKPDLINQTRSECAVLDRAEPTGNPCAAKLDEKTAKNITAELKALACAADGCDTAGGDQQNGNGNGGGKGDDGSGAGILRWSSRVLMGCVVASVMQWYL